MTALDVKQKIKGEYIFFEQMLLGTSRENIYNKCEEILFKKKTVQECDKMTFDEEDTRLLVSIDNLLEYIYEIHMTTKEADVEKIMEEIRYRISLKNRKELS